MVQIDVLNRQQTAVLEVVDEVLKHSSLVAVLSVQFDPHLVLFKSVRVHFIVLLELRVHVGYLHCTVRKKSWLHTALKLLLLLQLLSECLLWITYPVQLVYFSLHLLTELRNLLTALGVHGEVNLLEDLLKVDILARSK